MIENFLKFLKRFQRVYIKKFYIFEIFFYIHEIDFSVHFLTNTKFFHSPQPIISVYLQKVIITRLDEKFMLFHLHLTNPKSSHHSENHFKPFRNKKNPKSVKNEKIPIIKVEYLAKLHGIKSTSGVHA